MSRGAFTRPRQWRIPEDLGEPPWHGGVDPSRQQGGTLADMRADPRYITWGGQQVIQAVPPGAGAAFSSTQGLVWVQVKKPTTWTITLAFAGTGFQTGDEIQVQYQLSIGVGRANVTLFQIPALITVVASGAGFAQQIIVLQHPAQAIQIIGQAAFPALGLPGTVSLAALVAPRFEEAA